MSICANRMDDTTGTPCRSCPCGAAVKAEMEAMTTEESQ